jgi:hypothetical protein
MLSSLFAAITCLTFPASDPLEAPAVMAQGAAPVAVGTYVTPTSFRSRNFSDAKCLLVFTSQGVTSPIVVTLPVGGTVSYQFSAEALAGVSLEVVEVRNDVLTTTGVHTLVLPAGASDMSLWNVPAVPGFRHLAADRVRSLAAPLVGQPAAARLDVERSEHGGRRHGASRHGAARDHQPGPAERLHADVRVGGLGEESS